MEQNPAENFFDKLSQVIDRKELIKLVISNQKNKSSDLMNLIVTIARLKRGYRLNFVYRHKTKDFKFRMSFLSRISNRKVYDPHQFRLLVALLHKALDKGCKISVD